MKRWRVDRWLLAVTVAGVLLGAFYSAQAYARYALGSDGIFDFGFFHEALTMIAHGDLFGSLAAAGYPILADHAAFVLYPLALLYGLWPTVAFMYGVQGFALTLAAIPLYLWAREATGRSWLAALAAGAYLLSPWIETLNLFEWHPDCLWPLAVFGLLLALQRRRVWPALAWLALALACKNVLVLPLVGVGAWWAVGHRSDAAARRWGLGIMVAALLVFALDTHLQGALAPNHAAGQASYYGQLFGGHHTLEAGVVYALTHPLHSLAALTVPQGWATVAVEMATGAFAVVLEWPGALLVAIPVLMTVASSRWAVVWGQLQYPLALGVLLLPPLVLWLGRVDGPRLRLRAYFVGAFVVLTVVGLDLPQWGQRWGPPDTAALALVRMAPAQASLATTSNDAGAAASGRVDEYRLPPNAPTNAGAFYQTASQAQYVLWSPRAVVPSTISVDPALADAGLRDIGYRLVATRRTWQLWRRDGAATKTPAACRLTGGVTQAIATSLRVPRLTELRAGVLDLRGPSSVTITLTGWGYASVTLVPTDPHGLGTGIGYEWVSKTPIVRTVDARAGRYLVGVTNPAWAQGSVVDLAVTVQPLACP